MKHNLKITLILLSMFIITQFIGLYVVNHYSVQENSIPFGMGSPEVEQESDYYDLFTGILFAFVFAIFLLFLLTKLDLAFLMKIWFFVVVILALGIAFNSFISPIKYAALISIILAIPLAYVKIYRREFIIHNLTELLIYPGIAAVFVPILNIYTIILLLILISVYDMWAVWKSGIMQKMAKYQINNLKVFSGFFIPYASKKVKEKIKKMSKADLKKKGVKVNVAILGGGDVVFPIITAGVLLKIWGFIPALLVILGATLGLSYLFFLAEKKKFYPAMPFITAGIFLGMLISWFLI